MTRPFFSEIVGKGISAYARTAATGNGDDLAGNGKVDPFDADGSTSSAVSSGRGGLYHSEQPVRCSDSV